jgi:predicted nucleic acid-binding protein
MSLPTVLLDTCVLINILASGEAEPILTTLKNRWLICTAVKKETIYLRTEEGDNPLRAVSLDPLINSRLLEVCDIESEDEARLYVNYATNLDDGEAMSVALAVARGYTLATDERKARRIFLENGLREHLTCSSQIIREWSEAAAISPGRVKEALLEIMNGARFRPANNDDNRKWWDHICSFEN